MAVLSNTGIRAGASAVTSAGGDAYQIEKSLRFDFDDEAYLSRNIGSSGNRRTWTWAGWIKRDDPAETNTAHPTIWHVWAGAGDRGMLFIDSTADTLKVYVAEGSNVKANAETAAVLRDPSAWMHIMCVWDTTQSVEAERLKMYINGKLQTLSGTFPAHSYVGPFSKNTDGSWGPHGVGGGKEGSNIYSSNAYLADVYFIDGLALSPAAFGSFDSNTGVWNPKAFVLPAPNAGTTWSTDCTFTNTDRAAGNLFDGLTANSAAGVIQDNSSNTAKVTFNTTVKGSIIEVWSDSGTNVIGFNTDTPDQSVSGATWHTIYSGPETTLSKITWKHGSSQGRLDAIRVDGVILRDGQTDPGPTRNNPNDGTTWSSLLTGTIDGSHPAVDAFDGDLSDYQGVPNNGSETTVTFTHTFTDVQSLRVYAGLSGTMPNSTIHNGGSSENFTLTVAGGWTDLTSKVASLSNGFTSIVFKKPSSGYIDLYAIEVNGHILVDSTVDNSFHFKFNDVTKNRYLGKDTLNGKIADATGGKPIYNTSDDFGDVKGSGNRTDSLSGNLKLAIAGDNVTSTTMDVSSADHDVTNDGVTVSTDYSRFYGSSLKFVASETDTLKITGQSDFAFGTGDLCVEFWVYNTINKQYNTYVGTRSSGAATDGFVIASDAEGHLYVHSNAAVAGSYTAEHVLPLNQWVHVAYTRASGTHRLFMNGIVAANASTTSRDYTNDDICIGANPYDSEEITAYMNDVRVYKGAAKYTSNFKPPTRNDFTVNNLTAEAGELITSAGTIYKTNSTGATKDSPTAYNTDAGASSLVLAIPGDAIGSTTADVHQEINTSSSNKAASSLDPEVSSAQSKFYGNSLYFNSENMTFADSTDFDFGTGDYTIETWVRPNTNHDCYIFSVASGSTWWGLNFWANNSSNGTIRGGLNTRIDKAYAWQAGTWYHVALVRSSGTLKLYLDGSEIDSESDTDTLNCSGTVYIGRDPQGWNLTANMYINDLRVYKGYAKYTSNFTPPGPAVTTVGTDIDSLVDTPTNYGTDTGAGGEVRGNYCTLNSLDKGDEVALSQGNLRCVVAGGGSNDYAGTKVRGTMGVSSGKWYFEYTHLQNPTNGLVYLGIESSEMITQLTDGSNTGGLWNNGNISYAHTSNGNKEVLGAGSSYGNAWALDDVIGVAFDASNGNLWFSRNGTWQNSATKSEIEAGTTTNGISWTADGTTWLPVSMQDTDNGTLEGIWNFGQRAWANPSSVPSGYNAWCSTNLPDTFKDEEAGIVNNPSKYFDVKTWTGNADANGETQTISSLAFRPDFLWFKCRSHTHAHALFDQIRGGDKQLQTAPNGSNGEFTPGDASITAFSDTGFTMGHNADLNYADRTYVGWFWDAGTTASGANTAGSIDIASGDQWVNDTAGFSITKYTGTGSAETIGHGLSTPPELIITKRIDGSADWAVYHSAIGNEHHLRLNQNSAKEDSHYAWDDTSPTPDVFSVANASFSGDPHDYIAYCWAPKIGYSAFGAYTGNGLPEGPFVYTGFRIKYLMYKSVKVGDSRSWYIHDTSRTPINLTSTTTGDEYVSPDTNSGDGENIGGDLDFLSNGFKWRTSNGDQNDGNAEFIWCAFAEHPFKLARAR